MADDEVSIITPPAAPTKIPTHEKLYKIFKRIVVQNFYQYTDLGGILAATLQEFAGLAGLSDSEIEQRDWVHSLVLTRSQAKELAACDDSDVCSICLNDYTEHRKRVRLSCHHLFHLSCTIRWFREKPSCALCRQFFMRRVQRRYGPPSPFETIRHRVLHEEQHDSDFIAENSEAFRMPDQRAEIYYRHIQSDVTLRQTFLAEAFTRYMSHATTRAMPHDEALAGWANRPSVESLTYRLERDRLQRVETFHSIAFFRQGAVPHSNQSLELDDSSIRRLSESASPQPPSSSASRVARVIHRRYRQTPGGSRRNSGGQSRPSSGHSSQSPPRRSTRIRRAVDRLQYSW